EPAFYISPKLQRPPKLLTSRLQTIGDKLAARLGCFYRKSEIFDAAIYAALSNLTRTAAEEGWYLSPKEVPFDVEWFEATLNKFAHVNRSYWGTIFGIAWCVETSLVKNDLVRQGVSKLVLPFAMWLDRKIAKDDGFLKKALIPPNYAFHVWEAVAR